MLNLLFFRPVEFQLASMVLAIILRLGISEARIVNSSIDGFYAAYLTGSFGQGLVMLIFRHGVIVGIDVAGAKYDGTYTDAGATFDVKLSIWLPPNILLVQGANTGPQGDNSELAFQLPANFSSQPYIRVDAKHGPVNVKLTKLRELND